ncbi:MAG: 30S ribosomal protein S6 [Planctomycetota bacterium]
MADTTPRLYEGMFLVNLQALSGDLDGALQEVRSMLDRAGAEVVTLGRWDERKLAYPVAGQKRGVFLLSLFKVEPVQIANIERDCNLSDAVLRVLMTRADHMGEVELEAALDEGKTKAALESGESEGSAEAPAAEEASEPAEAAS